jgi:hypothetical protein
MSFDHERNPALRHVRYPEPRDGKQKRAGPGWAAAEESCQLERRTLRVLSLDQTSHRVRQAM